MSNVPSEPSEEIERGEKRVQERETALDRKFDILEQRDKEIGRRASELGRKEKSVSERDAELDRERLRQPDDAGLGRRVVGLPCVAVQTCLG